MSKVCSNLVVVTAAAVSLSAFGQIKLAPVLSDHAVLQAGEVIPVWGSRRRGSSLRTHTTENSTTTGCTGSDGQMSAGGGIDRKKSV